MTVLDEVGAERQRQRELGYGTAHDDEHTPQEIAEYARQYVGSTDDLREQRRSYVKAAATIVAAVERIDRISRAPESTND